MVAMVVEVGESWGQRFWGNSHMALAFKILTSYASLTLSCLERDGKKGSPPVGEKYYA